MRILLGFAVLLCAFVGQAEAACSVPSWRFVWGIETNAYITTTGGSCSLVLRRAFKTSEVHSLAIASGPHNGAASVSANAVTYRPRAGFKGEDSFVFAVSGRRNGGPERATVRVSVTVQ